MSDTPTTRVCTKCGTGYPATPEYFRRHKKGRYGLSSHCKKCQCVKKPLPVIPATRVCNKCGVEYPLSPEYFYPSKRYKYGMLPHCKSCDYKKSRAGKEKNKDYISEWHRQYYQENRQSILLKQREYKTANPDKVQAYQHQHNRTAKRRVQGHNRRARQRELPTTFTDSHWLACLEYFHNTCAVCGSQLRDLFGNIEPHGDHWIPLSSPACPGTIPENMLCLCSFCNLSKKDRLPDEWLAKQYSPTKAKQITKRINAYFVWIIQQPL